MRVPRIMTVAVRLFWLVAVIFSGKGRMLARHAALQYVTVRAVGHLSACPFGFVVRCMMMLALVVAPGSAVFSQPSNEPNSVTSGDVFARVARLRSEVEVLRHYMGKPRDEQPELNVRGAAPREVYFQALTLFAKADRLCFEQTRQRSAAPAPPTGEPHPADVLRIVDAALHCVEDVKKYLGINSTIETEETEVANTPTDVFGSIVQANRQLNLLLDERFAPSDVFQKVTRAVGYASCLLEQDSTAEALPNEPELEPGKTPADVYSRLLDCFDKLRAIAEATGVEMLEIHVDDALINAAEPSDVYDVAVLIVAELAHLHSQLPNAAPPREIYYVGRKVPSDVYRRAGMLERQLNQLAQRARARHRESDE